MAIAKLLIEMEANVAHLRKDMSNAADSIKGIAGAVSFVKRAAIGLGAALSIREIVSYARSAITAADDIGDMAETIGLAASEFQGLAAIAKEAGIEQEALAKSFMIFNRGLGDAARGTGSAKDALKAMGIAIKDSAGNLRSSQDIFYDVADALQKYKTEAERASLLNDLFGKSGAKLALIFKQNSAGIKEEIERLKSLNQFLGDDLIANADSAEKALNEMDRAVKVLSDSFVLKLAPAIALVANEMTRLISGAGTKIPSPGEFQKMSMAEKWKHMPSPGDINKMMREAAPQIGWEGSVGYTKKPTPTLTLEDTDAIEKAASEREKTLKDLDKYFSELAKMEREGLNDRELSLLDGLAREVRAEQMAMEGRIDALKKGRDELLADENLLAAEKQRIIAGTDKAIESETITSIARIARMTRDANAEIIESNRKKNEEILQGIIELDEAERQAVAQRKQYFTDFANDIEDRNMSFMQVYKQDMATLTAGFQTGFLDEETFKNSTKILTDEYNGWIEASRRTAQTMEGSFSDLFFGALQGNLDNFVENFIAAMDRIIADLAARNLFNWLAGSLGGGGGIGGFLFGGGRAAGGPVSAGRAYMVGERGPEMFLPAVSGRIEPGGRGGVVINMTVNANDAASFSRNKTRIAGEMAAELAYRQRRGDI